MVKRMHRSLAIRPAKGGLAVGHQQSQFTDVRFADDLRLTQGALPFTCLFRQNVAGMGFVVHKFAGARSFEPFRSGSIGFDFWHT
jgi:hypothetical protein